MRDEQLLEVIERYLNGEMSADERKAFEQFRIENAEVDQGLWNISSLPVC